MGNRLGRAPWGRSDMTTGWTEGKPWEIACGQSSVGKERDGSGDKVDGEEAVGHSLGRALWGRSGMEATVEWTEGELGDDMVDVGNTLGRAPLARSGIEVTTGCTERKPWEIAWGEFRWEVARGKRRLGGRRGNRGK